MSSKSSLESGAAGRSIASATLHSLLHQNKNEKMTVTVHTSDCQLWCTDYNMLVNHALQPISDVAWAPYSSTQFAALTTNGMVRN